MNTRTCPKACGHLAGVCMIAVLVPCIAPAQRLTLGIIGGTSLTGDFETGTYHSPGGTLPDGQTTSSTWTVIPFSRSFIIGPKLELTLPLNFSLEFEALHRNLHSKYSITELFSGGSQTEIGQFIRTHAAWEFPILAKTNPHCFFRTRKFVKLA